MNIYSSRQPLGGCWILGKSAGDETEQERISTRDINFK